MALKPGARAQATPKDIRQAPLETAVLNLERVHKAFLQHSTRTIAVAHIAAVLLSSNRFPPGWNSTNAVALAEEIMSAAEVSADKAKTLQDALENKTTG